MTLRMTRSSIRRSRSGRTRPGARRRGAPEAAAGSRGAALDLAVRLGSKRLRKRWRRKLNIPRMRSSVSSRTSPRRPAPPASQRRPRSRRCAPCSPPSPCAPRPRGRALERAERKPWITSEERMTPNVRKMIRSRFGKASPASVVSGRARRCCEETAPRIPAQPMTIDALPGFWIGRFSGASTRSDKVPGTTQRKRAAITASETTAAYPTRRRRRVAGRASRITGSCRPISTKSNAFRMKNVISHGETLEPCLPGRQLGRVPAHVDPDRDRGEDPRDVQRHRGQVGEVAAREGDRDGESGSLISFSPGGPRRRRRGRWRSRRRRSHEGPARVAEREGAADHGDDGELVGDERRAVVHEALAFDQGDEPARQPAALRSPWRRSGRWARRPPRGRRRFPSSGRG